MRYLVFIFLTFFTSCAQKSALPSPDLSLAIFSPIAKKEPPSLKIARQHASILGMSDEASVSRLKSFIDQYGLAATERALYEVSQNCRLEKRKFSLTEVKFYAEYYALFGLNTAGSEQKPRE